MVTIEIGKIEHILVNNDIITVQFTNFFNGGKFGLKRLTNTLINSNQKTIEMTIHTTDKKFEMTLKAIRKANYKIVDYDKNNVILEKITVLE